jgi:hypothetical protein
MTTLVTACQSVERSDGAASRTTPPVLEGLALPAGGYASGATGVTGLDATAAERLLGEPSLIRREAPAEVWQYRTAACVLDLFLYEGAAGPRVVYAEARTLAAEPVPAEPCLNQILAMRHRLSSS